MRYITLSLVSLALAACTPPEATTTSAAAPTNSEATALQTDQDKTLYALGIVIGQNVRENVADFKLTADEAKIVADGLRDAVLGAEPKVALDVYGPQIQVLAEERMSAVASEEKAASEAWVAEQARSPRAGGAAELLERSSLARVPPKDSANSARTARAQEQKMARS